MLVSSCAIAVPQHCILRATGPATNSNWQFYAMVIPVSYTNFALVLATVAAVGLQSQCSIARADVLFTSRAGMASILLWGGSVQDLRTSTAANWGSACQPCWIAVITGGQSASPIATLQGATNLASSIGRSEEHTSELQSHSFISYAFFSL